MAGTVKREPTLHALWREVWRRPEGRWPAMRWGLALLLPIALLLWIGSIAFAPDDPGFLRIAVQSQENGEPIEGATVVVGDVRYLTDASGSITIEPVPAGTEVLVSAPGHEPARAETASDEGEERIVWLGAVLIIGSVTDRISGEPVEGADIVVLDAAGEQVAALRTEGDGGFVFALTVEDATLVITHDIYGEHRESLQSARMVYVLLDPPPVTGRVVDAVGEPVAGASISGVEVDDVTNVDGRFMLDNVGQGTEISISTDGLGSVQVVVEGVDLGAIMIPSDATTPEASPAALEGEA